METQLQITAPSAKILNDAESELALDKNLTSVDLLWQDAFRPESDCLSISTVN